MRQSFFLLASVFCVAHEALAGPFVSANAGVSSVGYRGQTVRGQFTGDNVGMFNISKPSTYSVVNLVLGNQFSFGRAFVSPYGEVKAVLGDESFAFQYKGQNYNLYKSRSIFGLGAQIGYTLTHFAPYVRLGIRRQNVTVFSIQQASTMGKQSIELFRKNMAVNGLSWGGV